MGKQKADNVYSKFLSACAYLRFSVKRHTYRAINFEMTSNNLSHILSTDNPSVL